MNINDVCSFLDNAGAYFLATIEDNSPKCRPFGTSLIFENKLYIQTGKIKPVSKQIHDNNNVEISAFKDGKWIRISGKLVEDKRREAKKAMLDKYPSLRSMYNEDDGNTEVFYFNEGIATIYSFTDKPESITL